VLLFTAMVSSTRAEEIWVQPTYRADLNGLGIGMNIVWPVTPAGAVRFAFPVPEETQSIASVKVALISDTSSAGSTLTVYVCRALTGASIGSCFGPFTQTFTSTANRLTELDITSAFGSGIAGFPGSRPYLAVVAFTTPTTSNDHFVGLRFTADLGVRTDAKLTVLGDRAFLDLKMAGSNNTAIGNEAMEQGWRGSNNTALGARSMRGFNSIKTGNNNTAVGVEALDQLTGGSDNIAIGVRALLENNGGFENIAIGNTTP
jgi:hypothetical protein